LIIPDWSFADQVIGTVGDFGMLGGRRDYPIMGKEIERIWPWYEKLVPNQSLLEQDATIKEFWIQR